MKTLIQKELRENLKLAVIALTAGLVLLLLTVQMHLVVVKAVTTGASNAGDYDLLQPLCSTMFNTGVAFFCAIFGLVLCWVQIQNERPRDLWAFLVHRPMTRTEIFLGKMIAGLAIYFTVTALPLFCFVLWLRFLSPRVAPFDWSMIAVSVTGLVAGLAYYFAGMLVALRQVRWYASRGLPVLSALVVSALTLNTSSFWVACLGALLAASVLATAVWGAFHSNGDPAPQPIAGKLALNLSLAGGAFLAATLLAATIFGIVYVSGGRQTDYSYWTMTKDGTLYKVSGTQGNRTARITDLDGKPLLDPATGRAMDLGAFARFNCAHVGLVPNREEQAEHWKNYRQRSHFFLTWAITPDTAWYFLRSSGRLIAFDVRNHQIAGSLGPDGFVAGRQSAGPGFRNPSGYTPLSRVQTLNTDSAVYAVNVEKRTVSSFFTAPADDPILGAEDVLLNNYDWAYTVVITRSSVYLLKPNAELVWKTPYQKVPGSTGIVHLYFLEPAGHFALWSDPNDVRYGSSTSKLPLTISWLASERGVTKTIQVPKLGLGTSQHDWELQAANILVPAVRTLPVAAYANEGLIDWAAVRFSLAAALLLYLPISWWLGSRYALPLRSRLAWVAFILPGGLPALVAFLSVHEWPAREPCAGCGRLRVVTRDKCEHCGAEFSPAKRVGTEILEPVTA